MYLDMTLVAEWSKDGLEGGRLLSEGQLHGFCNGSDEARKVGFSYRENTDSKGI